MSRSSECKCDDRFTCRHCLDNAKPYHFTPSKSGTNPDWTKVYGEADANEVRYPERYGTEGAKVATQPYVCKHDGHDGFTGDDVGTLCYDYSTQQWVHDADLRKQQDLEYAKMNLDPAFRKFIHPPQRRGIT